MFYPLYKKKQKKKTVTVISIEDVKFILFYLKESTPYDKKYQLTVSGYLELVKVLRHYGIPRPR